MIYEQRAEIMDADNVSDVVEDFRAETIQGLVMAACPEATYPEQWDVQGLTDNVREVLDLDPPFEEWLKEDEVDQSILIERLQQQADEHRAEGRGVMLVAIDGKLAGLAARIRTSTPALVEPVLWYAIPAPHTFDLHPQRFELTPFIGLLNDGKPHELRVRVVGLAHDATGWTLLPHLQIWRDPKGARTRGELTSHVLGKPARNDAFSEENGRTVLRASGAGELKLAGWIETSEGRRDIEVAYRVGMQSRHDWDKGRE